MIPGSRFRAGAQHGRSRVAKLALAVITTLAFVCALAIGSAMAQAPPVLELVEDVPFERPEAWALQYYSSIATLLPLASPRTRDRWSIEAGLETSQVPHLDTAERTVGFNGFKEEDLNRLPVLVRPRVSVGLPAKLALELGYVPPLRVDGVEPHLLSLALERPLVERDRFALGVRLFGQTGTVEGDLTCSEADASVAPGAPGNEFGCEEPSRDESSLEHVGLHLGASYDPGRRGGPSLLFGAGVVRHDLEFQVDALVFGLRDRTLLRAEGTTWSLDAGVAIPATRRADLGLSLLWSPLDVVRPPRTSEQSDGLLHLRALLRYRVR